MRERLYRARHDRMLFGVAGGLARYLGIDSSIVRIVWVLLFLAAGTGILLYIVAAVLIPEEPQGYFAESTSAAVVAGEGRVVWPAILVIVGLALVVWSLRGRGRA